MRTSILARTVTSDSGLHMTPTVRILQSEFQDAALNFNWGTGGASANKMTTTRSNGVLSGTKSMPKFQLISGGCQTNLDLQLLDEQGNNNANFYININIWMT